MPREGNKLQVPRSHLVSLPQTHLNYSEGAVPGKTAEQVVPCFTQGDVHLFEEWELEGPVSEQNLIKLRSLPYGKRPGYRCSSQHDVFSPSQDKIHLGETHLRVGVQKAAEEIQVWVSPGTWHSEENRLIT